MFILENSSSLVFFLVTLAAHRGITDVVRIDNLHQQWLRRTADIGETAELACTRPNPTDSHVAVEWNYKQHIPGWDKSGLIRHITRNGVVMDQLKHKFSVHKHDDQRQQLLKIHKVQANDSGFFWCETATNHSQLAIINFKVPMFHEKACKGSSSVRLLCTSTLKDRYVVWRYSKTLSERRSFVYSQGNVLGADRLRYSVRTDRVNGSYDLVIADVRESDAGVYTCTEDGGFGPGEVCIRLTVNELTSSHCKAALQSFVETVDSPMPYVSSQVSAGHFYNKRHLQFLSIASIGLLILTRILLRDPLD